jgi:hypothetical protein
MQKPSKYNADIQTIANHLQRYQTCGDWFTEDNVLKIRVSNMHNKDFAFLTAVHEIIEQYLCERDGVSEGAVDTWDLMHEGQDEPGALPGCPYRKQHMIAEAIEHTLADQMGVDWEAYGIAMERAMDEKVDTKPDRKKIEIPKYKKKTRIKQIAVRLAETKGQDNGNETAW